MRRRIVRSTLAAALAASLFAPAAVRAQATEEPAGILHVTAGAVHTGTGEVYRPGAVTIVDGRITAVGKASDVTAPPGAKLIEAGPFGTIIPGLVVAHSQHLARGDDDPASVAPEVRALDGYDFFGDETAALSAGVTTVFLAPGSRRVVSGRGSVVKTAGASAAARTLRPDAGLVAGIGDAVNRPPSRIEPPDLPDATSHPLLPHRNQLPVTRAGSLLLLRDVLTGGREGDPSARDVASGAAPLWLAADTSGDLSAALELVAETGVHAVLVGARGARDVAPQLAAAKLPVILLWPDRPGRVSASGDARAEGLRARARGNAVALAAAGIDFALAPLDEASLPDTLFVCASAARSGLAPEDALAAVTSRAAAILGVNERVGSLAAGKDGDLVLLSGPPTDLRSFPLTTVVDGRVVWERKASPGTVVVRAGQVHVGDGTVYSPGEVAFEKGKVVEVGPSVGVPPGARFLDLGDGAVMPGLLDAFSHAGLAGEGGNADQDLSTSLSAAKAVDLADPSFGLLLHQGVTTVLAAPGGGGRIAGRTSIVKTGGPGDRILAEDAGLVVRLAGERDLPGAVTQLDGLLEKAKDYGAGQEKYAKDKKDYDAWKKKRDEELAKAAKEAEAKKKAEADAKKKEGAEGKEGAPPKKEAGKEAEAKTKGGGKPEAKKEAEKTEPTKPAMDEALAAYGPYLAGKRPVLVRASTVEELRAALKLLVDKWKLSVIVVGGDDARRLTARLTRGSVGVIASPHVIASERGRAVNLLRELALSGLPAAVGSDAYLGGAELFELLAYGVARGLSPAGAVRLATGDAAKLLGIDSRVGTLRPGRDADLILLSGPPFAPGSRITGVFVTGEEVDLADR